MDGKTKFSFLYELYRIFVKNPEFIVVSQHATQKRIIDVGVEDLKKLEDIVGRSPREVHTYLPTLEPTHTPIVLKVKQPKEEIAHPVATAGTTKPFHHLDCPNGDLMTFWQRTTDADAKYVSPYLHHGPAVKYVTFEPGNCSSKWIRAISCRFALFYHWFNKLYPFFFATDVGGWNNIRMQMELVLVFAYATGRTLVLPPDQPMYLLNKGKGHQKAHSFADFFPFDYINQRMSVITMEEFMRREGQTGLLRNTTTGVIEYPPNNQTVFDGTERLERLAMWDYLRSVGSCPPWKALNEFVVIPVAPGVNVSHYPPNKAKVYKDKRELFAAKRYAQYYDEHWQQQKLIHFISKPGLGYRLLEHFYTFIHFEDDAMDRYYKRFVRDYVHYIDTIFCKAAKIVNKLLEEGGGSYSSFHVRRYWFLVVCVDPCKHIPSTILYHSTVYQFIDACVILFFASFFFSLPEVSFNTKK